MKSASDAVTVAGTTRPSIMAEPEKLSSNSAAKSSVEGFIWAAGIKAPKGFVVTGQPVVPADSPRNAA